jgi:hypothetical protein
MIVLHVIESHDESSESWTTGTYLLRVVVVSHRIFFSTKFWFCKCRLVSEFHGFLLQDLNLTETLVQCMICLLHSTEGGGNQDEAFVDSSVKPAKSSFTASYSECGMCLDRLLKQIAVKPYPSNKRASSNEW